MKHKDIVKKIYEKHKDVLSSEDQVERVLSFTFMLFRSYVKRGKEFTFKDLFLVRATKHTYKVIREKRHKWNAAMKLVMKKRRSWHKKNIEDDFA